MSVYPSLRQYQNMLNNSIQKNLPLLDLSRYGYRNEGLLGQGTCGNVYYVKDGNQQARACKVFSLPECWIDSYAFAESARNEIFCLNSSLKNCPSAVRCYQCIPTQSKIQDIVSHLQKGGMMNPQKVHTIVILMEVGVNYKTIIDYILNKNNNVLTTEQALALMLDLFNALKDVHACNIIHRDVKPSNILLVERNGVLKPVLADFNISKLSILQTEVFTLGIGTNAYAAPEQKVGIHRQMNIHPEMAKRMDVYAMALIAYQLLNHGFLPFQTNKSVSNIQKAIDKRNNGDTIPVPENTPNQKLANCILQALRFRPEKRPSAEEMVMQLESIQNHKIFISKQHKQKIARFPNEAEKKQTKNAAHKKKKERGMEERIFDYTMKKIILFLIIAIAALRVYRIPEVNIFVNDTYDWLIKQIPVISAVIPDKPPE